MKSFFKNPRLHFGIAVFGMLCYIFCDILVLSLLNMKYESDRAANTTSIIVCLVIEALVLLLLFANKQNRNPLLGTLICIGLATFGIIYSVKMSLIFKTPNNSGIFWFGCIFFSISILLMCVALWITLMADSRDLSETGSLRPVVTTLFLIGVALFFILDFLFSTQTLETIRVQSGREIVIERIMEKVGDTTTYVKYTQPIGLSPSSAFPERIAASMVAVEGTIAIFQSFKPIMFLVTLYGIKGWRMNSHRREF